MRDAQWYEDMAAVMKKRDHALKMVQRWESAVFEAEQAFQQLAAKAAEPSPEQTQEQESSHAPAQL